MKFTATKAGQIKAIRFYKSANESGQHIGRIFSSSGQMARVIFRNETASGWQEQALTPPIDIAANTQYVVSVNTGNTYYVATVSGFAQQIANGNLRSVVGSNGVFGNIGQRPTNSYKNTNYFRDVVFVANSTPPPPPPPTPDVTAPSIPANLKATAISSSQIDLSWNASTDNVAVKNYRLERCSGSACTNFAQIAVISSPSYSNTSLAANTAYRFRVRAADTAATENLSAYSAIVDAATPAVPVDDTISPTVSITSPSNNATVSGSISIAANAADNVAVSAVQFSIDGGAYGADDVSQPYSMNLDTTLLANGVHKILARARDTAGKMTVSAEVSINVNNTVSSGGCAPYPAFPDASCTGWQHTGVALKTVPGQVSSGPGWSWEGAPFNYLKVTGSNVVLDGLDIQGCVYIDVGVASTTIKRSRISGGCNYLIRRADNNAAVTLTDVELVGGAVQMAGSNYKWMRVNARAFTGKAAMTGSNTTIEDSYIHDQVCNLPDHQSGIGTNGGSSNIIMRHNNVDMSPTGCVSGGIANYDDFGAFHNILIEKNLINSGGFCLKAGFEDNNAAGNTEMKVISNVFGRKYFSNCGSFGVVSNWMTGLGNIWSGNTWGGGAAANGNHNVGDTVNP